MNPLLLHMNKLELRMARQLGQGHTASEELGPDPSSSLQGSVPLPLAHGNAFNWRQDMAILLLPGIYL